MTSPQIQAAVLHAIGGTPRYEPFPAPVAGGGEVAVTVTAAALKPSDRAMANGVIYAPATFPHVVGLDGVGRLADGTRVAFFAPPSPYGGMAEQTLVRDGLWFAVPDGVDDVTVAGVLNPGGAAWKTVFLEGELAAGQSVLVLGATGTSGQIAAQLAVRHGARVVAAGRNQRVLSQLAGRGVAATIRVDRPRDELAAAIAAEGPYDLIVDYLWGAPAEAVFTALARTSRRAGGVPDRMRYVLVGMTAGAEAALPAVALRAAPVMVFGSGIGGAAPISQAAAAFAGLLEQVAAGEIAVDIDTVPLAEVEKTWDQPGGGRRVVFVP
jgi:NADPH:quinone reductase-like Zn-dependent oxidoreductase